MKYFKKGLFLFFFCFFMNIFNVSAKEVVFYFYADGGEVNTPSFSVNEYGDFISNDDSFYATYKGNDKITHINSIEGKEFTISKSGTSLVKGREWYFKNSFDNKYYFFSESKTYTIDGIFNTMKSSNSFFDFDLYPNWQNNPIKDGIDMKTGSGNTKPTSIKITASKTEIYVDKTVTLKVSYQPDGSDFEDVTWSTSNKSIATVGKDGKVVGKKEGTVTITAKSSSGLKDTIQIKVHKVTQSTHFVQIEYHANGGELMVAHGEKYKIEKDVITRDGNQIITTIIYGDTTSSCGLINTHSPNYLNLYRNGYYLKPSEAWNTKADGTGTTYSQTKIYQSTDFCDASAKDCKVILYANWKKEDSSLKIGLIGNSKTRFGDKHPKNNVADVFKDLLASTGKSAKVTVIVKGGSTLTYKANNDPYKSKIKDGTFDIVVLQEKSSTAANKNGNTFIKGVKEIKNLLDSNQTNTNTKYYVRTSWNKNNSSLDEDIQTMIANANKAANEIGGTPIYDGKAFLAANKRGINVFLKDKNHPTQEGAYLTALCIYKNIFHVNAKDIHYYYGLDKTLAKTIQSIVDSNC